jgi:hypothetical protein
MMNTKVVAYMFAAIAMGFVLISAVPERVSMLAAPTQMLRTDEPTLESGEPILSAEPELGTLENNGFTGLQDLYTWWAIDLVIAFSVYWVAKRRFL